MMMVGRYSHTIDQKGRIFVPVKLRGVLGDTFIVARVLNRCITVYPMAEWERFSQEIEANTKLSDEGPDIRHIVFSNAEEVSVDSQGRILLPKHLIAYAELQKNALFVGNGSCAEIWDPETFETIGRTELTRADLRAHGL